MMDYKGYLKGFISLGNYNLEELCYKLDKLYIEGKISEEDRDELVRMASDNAHDAAQVDLYEKVVDLEHRVQALEAEKESAVDTIPVWISGYTTQKGEVVKYDYNGDGEYDLLRYDGGRASTALRPGKIDGWHVVNVDGNILGTYYNGEFTPVD